MCFSVWFIRCVVRVPPTTTKNPDEGFFEKWISSDVAEWIQGACHMRSYTNRLKKQNQGKESVFESEEYRVRSRWLVLSCVMLKQSV